MNMIETAGLLCFEKCVPFAFLIDKYLTIVKLLREKKNKIRCAGLIKTIMLVPTKKLFLAFVQKHF